MEEKRKIEYINCWIDKYRRYKIFDDTIVNEGGWYSGRKWMTAKYLDESVNRWVANSFTTGLLEPDCKDHWIPHQCGGCRWFAALDMDYGICCNKESANDGKITFEHGGCVKHSDYSVL